MTTETIVLRVVLYLIFCIWVAWKQNSIEKYQTDKPAMVMMAFVFSPIWFIGALVRQFIIRKWD